MKHTQEDTARKIANYIIDYVYKKEEKLISFEDLNNEEIDIIDFKHLKLQKILYFLYGLYYSHTNQELFKDDFTAYKYGPVIVSIYNEIKKVCPNPYENLPKDIFASVENENVNFFEKKDIINNILDNILKLSTWRLVEISHLPDSPWSLTEQSATIDKKKIKDYFSTKEFK